MFLREYFKRVKLQFEDLPNEILILIFEFLYCDEIIYSFDELNSRFYFLLRFYSNYYLSNYHGWTQVNIKSIQKFPFNTENVKCLTLSDEKCPCIDAKQFLLIYPIELFYSKLEILSLDLTTDLLVLLPNFQKLKYFCLLSLNHRSTCQNSEEEEQIYKIILFQIKTLKYFQCNLRLPIHHSITLDSSVVKSSIEYFQFMNLSFDRLEYLYLNTTKLKSISIQIPPLSYYSFQQVKSFNQLTSLKLMNVNSKGTFNLVFHHIAVFSQLKQLELKGNFVYEKDFIDGDRFQHLIRQCFSRLKIFRFYFTIYNWNSSANVEDFIKSFSTDFWLIEKQWFVSVRRQIQLNRLHFYTNPCIETCLDYVPSWIETSDIHQLTLTEICEDLTYDQLNRCVNLCSVRCLEWKSKTNLKLLCNILNHRSTDLFLKINYDHLLQILEKQNVKSLEINFICSTKIKENDLRHLILYFPNVEQLVLIGDFLVAQIIYLITHLEHLTLLIIHANKYPRIAERVLLSGNNRKKICYRCQKDTVYLWIFNEIS